MKILDHGELVLLDVMGSDKSIADAARISYSNTKVKSSDNDLIRYMWRHGHHSPFEMAELLFYVKAPIMVFRQWHRHRTGSLSEVSGRYSELTGDTYTPTTLRKQSKTNKQGSSNETIQCELNTPALAKIEYEMLLKEGVAKEQARLVLPVATYSEMYWKCDLRNIFNFLRLRLDPHAQAEIREYAKVMADMVYEKFPMSFNAFENYTLNALTLSREEVGFIIFKEFDPTKWGLGKRETEETLTKFDRLHLICSS